MTADSKLVIKELTKRIGDLTLEVAIYKAKLEELLRKQVEEAGGEE